MALPRLNIAGDEARQAIDALRGYAYQIYASATAWLQITDDEILHLEIAEDFATSSDTELIATQTKATKKSLTINDDGVIAAIEAFFFLSKCNPARAVTIRYLTSSSIGAERNVTDRINGEPALRYWQKAAALADVSPLRELLGRSKLSSATRAMLQSFSDTDFRENFLKRIIWATEGPTLEGILDRLRDNVIQAGLDRDISQPVIAKCVDPVIARILAACTDPSRRSLSVGDLTALIDECTSIRVPIDQALQQQRILQTLIEKQGLSSDTSIRTPTRREIFKPISTPSASSSLASRSGLQEAVINRLSKSNVAWLYAGTGFGKTTLARLGATRIGGTWRAINVRNIDARELPEILYAAAQALSTARYSGIILDDVEHFEQTDVAEATQYLLESAANSTCLVIASSYNKPSEAALSAFGVDTNVALHVPELNEGDVREVVAHLAGDPDTWSRYVYLASGCGHPQLVQALSRNLANRGWPFDEIKNLNALLGQNTELLSVRRETRKRLVNSLDREELDLLTRLTVIPGKFDRDLVLKIGEGDPPIPNAGLAFDGLVGPWIDEAYEGVYQVSPLVSDLATTTVPEANRLQWQRVMALASTAGRSLDAGKMNAALLMSIAADERSVLMKIAVATIQLDGDELSKLGTSFFVLQGMSVDQSVFAADPYINVLLRLAQLLLLTHEDERDDIRIGQVWEKLLAEVNVPAETEGRAALELMVLSKALSTLRGNLSNPVRHLHRIYEITRSLPYEEIRDAYTVRKDGQETTSLGIMFLMQAQGLEKIANTLAAFEALDVLPADFRSSVLDSLNVEEMDADMYLSGPWLKEHHNNTIDAERHAEMYARIASLALGWDVKELAVAATKYQAVVLDEYGNAPGRARAVLESARDWAGPQDWDLLRAEAKILYRAKEYDDALPLYDELRKIDAVASVVEKAFMLREAAICAAETGDWALAARFFGEARDGALQSDLRSMTIMATGLLGDMAVANWQAGERAKFVECFHQGLLELSNIDVDEGLHARHCHALYRHALLWAQDKLTGNVKIKNDEKPQMLAGAISSPEPSPSIEDHRVSALSLAWYMLAAIEIQCGLPPKTRDELDVILNGKTLVAGENWLGGFTLDYYQRSFDSEEIVRTTRQIAVTGILARSAGQSGQRTDLEKPEYLEIRPLTEEENRATFNVFEVLLLGSAVTLLGHRRTEEVRRLFGIIRENYLDKVSKPFAMTVTATANSADNFEAILTSRIIEAATLAPRERLTPERLAHLQLLILQIPIGSVPSFGYIQLMHWFKDRWLEAIGEQGFLLNSPGLFARELKRLPLDDDRPLASAARIVALAINHISVQIPNEYRTLLANLIND